MAPNGGGGAVLRAGGFTGTLTMSLPDTDVGPRPRSARPLPTGVFPSCLDRFSMERKLCLTDRGMLLSIELKNTKKKPLYDPQKG